MIILPLECKLLSADIQTHTQTDRQTDITELTVAIRNVANPPKHGGPGSSYRPVDFLPPVSLGNHTRTVITGGLSWALNKPSCILGFSICCRHNNGPVENPANGPTKYVEVSTGHVCCNLKMTLK